MKNPRKKVSTDDKLDVISRHEKVNELLTYAVELNSLIAAYRQFVIILIELQTVLSQ